MKTEIIKTKRGSKLIFEKIAFTLKNGGLVAFPTETVYWLGANALSDESCKKIYTAKWRPSDNPLIIHIEDPKDIIHYGTFDTIRFEKLIQKFWPGPLTLIIKKKNIIWPTVSGWLDTVAIRCPKHPIAKSIIKFCWFPIAAPSANTSGKPSPTNALSVFQDLNGKIDIIVDGGHTQVGLESTVLDISWEIPTILRHGSITFEMLKKIIPNVTDSWNEEQKKKSPGTRYKHYSPETPVVISSPKNRNTLLEEIISKENACFIGLNITQKHHLVFSFKTKKELAKWLFSTLRACDTKKIKTIYIESIDERGIGKALMNRISKSAGIL